MVPRQGNAMTEMPASLIVMIIDNSGAPAREARLGQSPILMEYGNLRSSPILAVLIHSL